MRSRLSRASPANRAAAVALRLRAADAARALSESSPPPRTARVRATPPHTAAGSTAGRGPGQHGRPASGIGAPRWGGFGAQFYARGGEALCVLSEGSSPRAVGLPSIASSIPTLLPVAFARRRSCGMSWDAAPAQVDKTAAYRPPDGPSVDMTLSRGGLRRAIERCCSASDDVKSLKMCSA